METSHLLRELSKHLHFLATKADKLSYEHHTDPTDDWFYRGKSQAYRTAADVLSFRANLLDEKLDRELTAQETAEMLKGILANS